MQICCFEWWEGGSGNCIRKTVQFPSYYFSTRLKHINSIVFFKISGIVIHNLCLIIKTHQPILIYLITIVKKPSGKKKSKISTINDFSIDNNISQINRLQRRDHTSKTKIIAVCIVSIICWQIVENSWQQFASNAQYNTFH